MIPCSFTNQVLTQLVGLRNRQNTKTSNAHLGEGKGKETKGYLEISCSFTPSADTSSCVLFFETFVMSFSFTALGAGAI